MKYLILLLLAFSASAGEWEIQRGVFTDHLNSGNFNEQNDLTIVRYDQFFMGYMSNSYDNDTYFGGFILPYRWGPVEVSTFAGLSYGYCWNQFTHAPGGCERPDLIPIVGPQVTLRKDFDKFFLTTTARMVSSAVNISVGVGYGH